MHVYNDVEITKKVWDFFYTEEGLSVNQLLTAIDIALNGGESSVKNMKATLAILDVPRVMALVKFYRDTEGLSVNTLLQFDTQIIKTFALYDTDFMFHKWILQHKLEMPDDLTREGCVNIIPHLGLATGIEFLNLKIIAHPENEWQQRFDDFITDHNEYFSYFKLEMAIRETLKQKTVGRRLSIQFDFRPLRATLPLSRELTPDEEVAAITSRMT